MSHGEIDDYFKTFGREVKNIPIPEEIKICFFPPYPYLRYVHGLIMEYGLSGIEVGAQDVSMYERGAYTGDVSPFMIIDCGCSRVIVGHSERRKYHGETNGVVAEKVRNAIRHGLKVVMCVGETLDVRERGEHKNMVQTQIHEAFQSWGFSPSPQDLVIAYEPVWAIGTGINATSEQIHEMHSFIKECAGDYDVIYGGSVSPENIGEIISVPEVDGVLVGGASLNPNKFMDILKAFVNLTKA